MRTDGVPVRFIDETIPDRLAEAIINGQKRQGRLFGSKVFDCYYFAAAIHGLPLDEESAYGFEIDTETRTAEEDTPETDVVIGRGYHDIPIIPDHVIVPAHQLAGEDVITPSYLHKLGIKGPICISGLGKAMRLMGSGKAHPITRPNTSQTH